MLNNFLYYFFFLWRYSSLYVSLGFSFNRLYCFQLFSSSLPGFRYFFLSFAWHYYTWYYFQQSFIVQSLDMYWPSKKSYLHRPHNFYTSKYCYNLCLYHLLLDSISLILFFQICSSYFGPLLQNWRFQNHIIFLLFIHNTYISRNFDRYQVIVYDFLIIFIFVVLEKIEFAILVKSIFMSLSV